MAAVPAEPGPAASPPLASAVRALAEVEALDMAFAASLDARDGTFCLGHMSGARAGSMDGLVTAVGQGLGGKVLAVERPLAVADYARAPGITHQFDQAVSAEGLRAVFALPVRVDGTLHGAVYGAMRRPVEFGERFLARMAATVRAAVRPGPSRSQAAPVPTRATSCSRARRPASCTPSCVRRGRAPPTRPPGHGSTSSRRDCTSPGRRPRRRCTSRPGSSTSSPSWRWAMRTARSGRASGSPSRR
ncbi:GAF domain-containing protein [Actinomycetospora sp. CA-053990]|uniref:GAF domain-containing protein n=1 Tax=Actinomycetospora sp. CA-053990 TaxID=3239891 RepID=UPI003D8C5AE2